MYVSVHTFPYKEVNTLWLLNFKVIQFKNRIADNFGSQNAKLEQSYSFICRENKLPDKKDSKSVQRALFKSVQNYIQCSFPFKGYLKPSVNCLKEQDDTNLTVIWLLPLSPVWIFH